MYDKYTAFLLYVGHKTQGTIYVHRVEFMRVIYHVSNHIHTKICYDIVLDTSKKFTVCMYNIFMFQQGNIYVMINS